MLDLICSINTLIDSALSVVGLTLNADKISKLQLPLTNHIHNYEKVRAYLKGAYMAGYRNFIARKNQGCNDVPAWRVYEIGFHLQPGQKQTLREIFHDSWTANQHRNWYIYKEG